MFPNRKLLLIILIAALPLIGFGCKGLSQEQAAAVKPVKLNYWTVYNDLDQLDAFKKEYEAQRPYVKINIKKVRAEELEQLLLRALADDVPPDIISVSPRDLRRYVQWLSPMPASVKVANVYIKSQYTKEQVVTIEENQMPSASAVKKSFVSAVYDDAVIDGKVYGLPLAFDTLALYYNKELLDKSGVAEIPKTWDEFMAAVKAGTRFNEKGDIVQSGVALGTGNNIERSFDILSLFMLQSGVKMASGNRVSFADGLTPNKLNHPALVALRFYTDFARPTKEVYSWNESMKDALETFASGKSVFYFGFAYDYPLIKARAPQMDLEIMPVLQLNEAAPVNVANYWLETVVKKSKHQDEAWDFVRSMTTPDNIKKYTDATKRPTPLRAQIKDQEADEMLKPFVSTILQAESWYRGENKEAAAKVFTEMLHNSLQPSGSTKSENQKDVQLLTNAAKLIQQTM